MVVVVAILLVKLQFCMVIIALFTVESVPNPMRALFKMLNIIHVNL